jgi:hypothetical protein
MESSISRGLEWEIGPMGVPAARAEGARIPELMNDRPEGVTPSMKLAPVAVAAALAVLALALAVTPISNNDIWLHLKTGSLILERGSVPSVEEYTFSVAGRPLVDHEWLAQVLFAVADDVGGIQALTGLKVILTAAILLLTFLACGSTFGAGIGSGGWSLVASATAASGMGLLLATHLSLRPHLFSLILIGIYSLVLARMDRDAGTGGRGMLMILIFLQILWANLHGGFILGIVLVGLHLAGEAWIQRSLPRSSALPLVLGVAALVNPYGFKLYELVGAFSEPAFREFILEWQHPFGPPFAMTTLFWVYLVWLVLAGTGAVIRNSRGDRKWLVIFAGFALLSATSVRHISLLAVVTAPLVAVALGEVLRIASSKLSRGKLLPGKLSSGAFRPGLGVGWAAAAIPLGLAWIIGTSGVPWVTGQLKPGGIAIGESMPVEAARFMESRQLQGRVFTSLGFGAYVTYSSWPRLKTYVDSRLEVFGGEFLRRYNDAVHNPGVFRSVERNTPFDFALLSWRLQPVTGAVGALTSDPDWELIYFDDVALLYAKRRPETEALIEEHGYQLVDPFRFAAGMGFAPDAGPHLIELETQRAILSPGASEGRRPMNTMARIMQGSALQLQGRHGEATVEFRGVLRTRPDAFIAHGLLGSSLLELGELQGARREFQILLEAAPGSNFAREMLKEVASREAGGN